LYAAAQVKVWALHRKVKRKRRPGVPALELSRLGFTGWFQEFGSNPAKFHPASILENAVSTAISSPDYS